MSQQNPDPKPEVVIPEDLQKRLEKTGLAEKFRGLSPSHVHEYVKWIDEAKKPETRARRIEGAIERFKERTR